MPFSQTLLPEFDEEMKNTRKLLECVPDGKFDYQPHPKSMTLGRLASHVAELPSWTTFTLDREVLELGPDFKPDIATSRAQLLENFDKYGSTIITVVNREYCKRVIVLLPGQTHPEQYHIQKDETYHILHGEISLSLDGVTSVRKANDIVVIPRGVRHGFTTRTGTVIEEVSSSYMQGDSFYTDATIEANANRKTFVTHWMD